MNTVLGITPKGEKAAILNMENGDKVWTPEKEKAEALVGKEIPSDWTIKQGDYGPQAFPPREKKGFGGGGAAAWRNSKEGAQFDATARLVNTAIMQAEGDLGRAAEILAWGEAQLFKVPAAPSQPTSSTAQVGKGAAAGRVQESVGEAGSCTHKTHLLSRPDGGPLPAGFFRCPDCNKVMKG